MHRFKSISEFHNYSNLPKSEHPLISLVDYSKVNYATNSDKIKWMQDFYSIGLYQSNIDKFSQNIIISHIELLLNYAERYYERQFITRKISNHQILIKLEQVLNNYFNNSETLINGIPSVVQISNDLNLSPNYLSSVLKIVSGQSTQQHIQNKLIEKAKEKLSTTELSVSEIAYELGFEYPASFSKLFKSKTNVSPIEFRQSFN